MAAFGHSRRERVKLSQFLFSKICALVSEMFAVFIPILRTIWWGLRRLKCFFFVSNKDSAEESKQKCNELVSAVEELQNLLKEAKNGMSEIHCVIP